MVRRGVRGAPRERARQRVQLRHLGVAHPPAPVAARALHNILERTGGLGRPRHGAGPRERGPTRERARRDEPTPRRAPVEADAAPERASLCERAASGRAGSADRAAMSCLGGYERRPAPGKSSEGPNRTKRKRGTIDQTRVQTPAGVRSNSSKSAICSDRSPGGQMCWETTGGRHRLKYSVRGCSSPRRLARSTKLDEPPPPPSLTPLFPPFPSHSIASRACHTCSSTFASVTTTLAPPSMVHVDSSGLAARNSLANAHAVSPPTRTVTLPGAM